MTNKPIQIILSAMNPTLSQKVVTIGTTLLDQTKENISATVQRIAHDYAKTPDGKKLVNDNGGTLTWAHFLMIPYQFTIKYGVRVVSVNDALYSTEKNMPLYLEEDTTS